MNLNLLISLLACCFSPRAAEALNGCLSDPDPTTLLCTDYHRTTLPYDPAYAHVTALEITGDFMDMHVDTGYAHLREITLRSDRMRALTGSFRAFAALHSLQLGGNLTAGTFNFSSLPPGAAIFSLGFGELTVLIENVRTAAGDHLLYADGDAIALLDFGSFPNLTLDSLFLNYNERFNLSDMAQVIGFSHSEAHEHETKVYAAADDPLPCGKWCDPFQGDPAHLGAFRRDESGDCGYVKCFVCHQFDIHHSLNIVHYIPPSKDLEYIVEHGLLRKCLEEDDY